MIKYPRYLTLLLFIIAIYQSTFAVKAYPYPIEYTQPDGSKINIILKGDERVKWAQTLDGYSIMLNSKRFFEYAILDSKRDMVPSGFIVKNAKDRSKEEIELLNRTSKDIRYSPGQVSMLKSISKFKSNSIQKSFPTTGDRNLLVILMGFKDKAFTKIKADFDNLFNQVGYNFDGATGSVKDYYKENSYNLLNLIITVAGPYTSANKMAYYGANDANGDDVKPDALIEEAVTLANPDVNYALFDNDNNGKVDGVYVIYAGYGEEAGGDANTIWAHAFSISKFFDGKTINNYSCSAELRGNSGTGIARIGVICHEFGHTIGANDYYDTDYTTNGEYIGTGDWDIMANGSWNNNGATPAHHNPYTKIHDFSWATATTLSAFANITLNNSAENSNSFYRINTQTTNEYFLIENRQKLKFDNSLPGHGMLIYHVDGNFITANENGGTINTGSHQGFYPVYASALGNPPSDYGLIDDTGCPFPGTGLKTSFSDFTTPHSRSWAGVNTGYPITNITENTTAKTVTFTVTKTVGIENEKVSNQNLLCQNYPNPFDKSTSINFSITGQSHVVLSVFDALGKEVDQIVNDYFTPGSYTKIWTPTDLPSGIYFYQLRTDKYRETKRLVIKK